MTAAANKRTEAEKSSREPKAGRAGRPAFQTELLAPAGSIEALKAAYIAGADAVYIGGSRFGARAYADNPGEAELCEAIDLSHRLGKKLYMTVNTLVKDSEMEKDLETFMNPYVREGLDGVIVQDFGVIDLFQQVFPDLPLHASTQMSVTGVHGAAFMKEIGMSRIVPARELSLEEIRLIHDRTGLEIESFIHGAMCYSYSGQCLMSSLIGGRSGNRGRCAGVCRLPFDVYEDGRLLTGRNTRYPLNMKDMNTVEILPELIRAGISSFKIEGRMKKPEYTAGVVRIYRKYIDRFLADPEHYRVESEDLEFLWNLFNRDGFHQGCYLERNGRDMIALRNEKLSDVRQKAAQELTEQIRADLNTREAARKLQSPVAARLALTVSGGAVLDLFWSANQSPYLQDSPDLFRESVPGKTGAIHVCLRKDGVQKAENRPVTEDRILAQMNKTGNSAFYFQTLQLDAEENLFVPMQLLNELRREGFAALSEKIREKYRRSVPSAADASQDAFRADSASAGPICKAPAEADFAPVSASSDPDCDTKPFCTASVNTIGQLRSLLDVEGLSAIWLDAEMFTAKNSRSESLPDAVEQIRKSGKSAYLMLPYVMRRDSEAALTSLVHDYMSLFPESPAPDSCAILARNLEELGLLRFLGLAGYTEIDAGIYTMNTRAENFLARRGYSRNTASLELNYRELLRRENRTSELIVYGRAPMMLSAHCLKKTMDRCTRSDARLVLKDRKGARFPAECHCTSCYNIIYNSLPTSLLREHMTDSRNSVSPLDRLHFRSFRLQFTDESGPLAAEIAAAFLERRDVPEPETTRGHFRRGVE